METDRHDDAGLSSAALSCEQWHQLCACRRLARLKLRRLWGSRCVLDDAVAEGITLFAEKVARGECCFPASMDELVITVIKESRRFLRHEQRHWEREMSSELLQTDDAPQMPSFNLDDRMAIVMDVRNALAKIPPLLRDAIVAVEIEDTSLAEAARVLGCSVNALKQRVFRARRMLRQLLIDYQPYQIDTERGGGVHTDNTLKTPTATMRPRWTKKEYRASGSARALRYVPTPQQRHCCQSWFASRVPCSLL